jgi:site-specific DNA-methyltransferase (adenine-specific)
MKTLADNSVDAVVTDPPYGLAFMNKKWDYDVPSVDIWREVYRVLKPGGHVLSFGGTRTYHRMVVNIEDAGFEIRDQVMWIYGSGFPKSHNVSKAIDKMAGVKGETYVDEDFLRRNPTDNDDGVFDSGLRDGVAGAIRTRPATPEAKQWDGWGSALKPANEPICLARKPLEKGLTLAENVLKYGTGAINIDGTRIGTDTITISHKKGNSFSQSYKAKGQKAQHSHYSQVQGRWPANVLFDERAAEMLDAQSGELGLSKGGSRGGKRTQSFGMGAQDIPLGFNDSGGASRFFYVAKASKSERNRGLDSSFLVWENDAWEKQDLKSALTAMLELVKDTSADILADDSSWSTDIYGHSISEQYPKGMIFTISTVLKTITELKTSNVSLNLNTRESIQDAIRTIEANGLSLAESVSFINQLELNTTSEKTAYLLGVVRAALPTLLQIKDAAKTNNFHSTVKPIKLMEYLITLITPPNGTILDPFAGSGSTLVAAKNLNFNFVGIERDPEYHAIAQKRIEHTKQQLEIEDL